MSARVECRVCGWESPWGTLECPECGAPLPRTVETPTPAAVDSLPVSPQSEGEETVEAPKDVSPKRRRARLVAGAVAVCLILALAAAVFWPGKPPLPGVALVGNTFVTPDGVWDYAQAGFRMAQYSVDGQHWVLLYTGESGNVKTKEPVRGQKNGGLERDAYYLYNGQTLECIGRDFPILTKGGLFRVQATDEGKQQLLRRDLKTGKTVTLDEAEQGAELEIAAVAQDGSAVAYVKRYNDGVTEEKNHLWVKGDKVGRAIDCPGNIYAVANGGKRCMFVDTTTTQDAYSRDFSDVVLYGGEDDAAEWDWGDNVTVIDLGDAFGSYVSSNRSQEGVWEDGEITAFPGGMVFTYNADLTEFIYRTYSYNIASDWYFYALGGEPVHLPALQDSYLEAIPQARGSERNYYYYGYAPTELPATLRGRFYLVYDEFHGKNTIYYLTPKGEFLFVDNGMDYGNVYTNAAESKVIYLKNGDLYCAGADMSGTVAVTQWTGSGKVQGFESSADLQYIYYYQSDDPAMSHMLTLYRWHDGESENLGMEFNRNYGNNNMVIDNSGECYFAYTRNCWFIPRNGVPELVLEEVGANGSPMRVAGGETWYLLNGSRWEDGANQQVYWRLDGNKMPQELPAWQPEEGTV